MPTSFPAPTLRSSPRLFLASRLLVAALLAVTVVLTAAQQLAPVSPWWLELSRYLPYPVYLAPVSVALGLALVLRLGRGWQLASAAGVLLVAVVTMDYCWHIGSPPAPPDTRSVRFMTYNIKAYKAAKRSDGLQALAREIAAADPDILVMQDAQTEASTNAFRADMPVFGLPHVYVAASYVVASRLPLRDCRTAQTQPGRLGYVSCVVDVGGVDVTVATVHFESPRRGLVAARREGLDGAADWQRNYAERLVQAHGLANALEAAPRPLIVAGDLNAPEASPVVGTLRGLGLRDAFSAAGRGWGYSYGDALSLGFAFLRIDHILVSARIEVTNCYVGNAGPSEHRAVVADLRLRP